MKKIRQRILLITVSLLTCLLFSLTAQAASSILVWPVYQIIEADQKGSALWLENRGNVPVTLQIRIMAWKQQDNQDKYASQTEAIASPPFTTIPAGKRQLVRLMKNVNVPPNTELAYRIIIDEIPALNPTPEHSGLTLQMRYLLPLFLDGEGIRNTSRSSEKSNVTKPELSWRLLKENGKTALAIKNTGKVHARLSHVFFAKNPTPASSAIMLANGFFTYVLPGQEMHWPLPDNKIPPATGQLYSQISDNDSPILIRAAGQK